MTSAVIPVVLFAYARPTHLARVLGCLRQNNIPLLYVFSDGPRGNGDESNVGEVRALLHAIDWCKTVLVERSVNMGLGRSVLVGVTEVLKNHEAIIVFEDDLICVPGAYDYLCRALDHYRHDQHVMSVTGWTHPRVRPSDVVDQPYFDGRAECWVWGTWRRVWEGMRQDALTLMADCVKEGIDPYRYGADLAGMARGELSRNIWAVRFLYLHIRLGGLCLRPPHSMVEHIGFDNQATNSPDISLENPPLVECPKIPGSWPDPFENLECPGLWQDYCGRRPEGPDSGSMMRRGFRYIRARLSWVQHRLSGAFRRGAE